MKKIGKFSLRVAALALALILAYAAYPYARDFLRNLLNDVDFDRSASVISHEMEKLGELTSLRTSDEGVMDASVDALLVGKVASVRAAYRYEAGFGVDLTRAVVSAEKNGVSVALPAVRMLYDSFEVTDAPEINDFFSLIDQEKYQEMLSEQALACRAAYTGDADTLARAREAAREALGELIARWTGGAVACEFTEITE